MSTQTTTFGTFDFAGDQKSASGKSLLKQIADRFIEARTAEARAQVSRHLANMSDDHLRSIGLTSEQVKELRRSGRLMI